ncbi:MAG: twin-arginine translocase TatA/TatE family subunit [archaeon]|nr:twin-arginine translocase TatA/TatE family subunit [archaeon]MCP8314481.1 twin-arginine translocase TatA/TatE family subunit [archaeon]MCP8317483.1 twin-arginine translocase TatA/TatE family subunit [archaeon]MCP8319442.1 twin-arginine translocase TatA/TatE family subunit [archaeon]
MLFGIEVLQIIGGTEWIWIILFVVVLLFGAKKIPEIAKALGRARGEFEKGKQEIEKEIKEAEKEATQPVSKKEDTEREKLIKAANALGISTYGKTDEQLREEIQVALLKK